MGGLLLYLIILLRVYKTVFFKNFYYTYILSNTNGIDHYSSPIFILSQIENGFVDDTCAQLIIL